MSSNLLRLARRAVLIGALGMLLIPLVATTSVAADWKGKDVAIEGIRTIQNPAEPIHEPFTATLDELWRLGGDTDVEEEFFGVILGITNDDEGNIFLLDLQLAEIKIFSSDGEYINTIGREGEGPGEFRFPISMFFLPSGNVGVIQAFPGKIITLTPEGDPSGDLPLPPVEGGGNRMLMGGQMGGDNLVLACRLNTLEEGQFTQTCFIAKVDEEGNEASRYHSEDRVLDFANVVIDESVHETYEQGR